MPGCAGVRYAAHVRAVGCQRTPTNRDRGLRDLRAASASASASAAAVAANDNATIPVWALRTRSPPRATGLASCPAAVRALCSTAAILADRAAASAAAIRAAIAAAPVPWHHPYPLHTLASDSSPVEEERRKNESSHRIPPNRWEERVFRLKRRVLKRVP